jgi:hypothetical protein
MRRILVYWLKLLEMHDSRYPKQCYYMLLKLDAAHRITWTSVRNVLARFGFNYAWFSQEVGDINEFVSFIRDYWIVYYKSGVEVFMVSPS